jgi:glucose/arabinose dehydrogenase
LLRRTTERAGSSSPRRTAGSGWSRLTGPSSRRRWSTSTSRSGGEQGLLGLAVHPSFPLDPRVFINYTDNSGDEIIASLELDPNHPNRLLADSHRRILFIEDSRSNHNGGALLFGPDGYLYVFNGDGGGGGDPDLNGQNPDALLAKILRLDIDEAPGDLGYGIPADNPFASGGGAPEVWHLGVRNPWRASFDLETGDLWFGDVGQGQWEEIDFSPAGLGGLNYGWNVMEGAHCYGGDGCDQEGLTLPLTEYTHSLGCTVIGGYVYRGEANPAFRGAYVFADHCSGRIFAIDAATRDLVDPVEVGAADGGISAFGEDVGGELYLLNLDGSIWRLVATPR